MNSLHQALRALASGILCAGLALVIRGSLPTSANLTGGGATLMDQSTSAPILALHSAAADDLGVKIFATTPVVYGNFSLGILLIMLGFLLHSSITLRAKNAHETSIPIRIKKAFRSKRKRPFYWMLMNV